KLRLLCDRGQARRTSGGKNRPWPAHALRLAERLRSFQRRQNAAHRWKQTSANCPTNAPPWYINHWLVLVDAIFAKANLIAQRTCRCFLQRCATNI
ncbi:MAG: hypothetical protein ACLU99_00005, partial [Alphaproteobacteria bacterium]